MDRGRQTVKFYGLIYFQCKDGYLAASGLDGERLHLRTPSVVGDTADEALPFFGFAEACVFRIVPTLSSRAATSSVKGAGGAASSQSDSGGGGAGSADDKPEGSTASALGRLDGSLYFDPSKTADIIDVEEITYGKSFSLVHEASGFFVSVAHALPSENDPDCLSVVLVKPSAAVTPSCEFTLVSRYKIHADGDKLCRADSVLIRLVANPMFLHVSSAPMMQQRGDNEGDVELLHRTFRFGSSLTYAAKTRLGPGGVGGAVVAAATAAQGSCLSLQGSFAMPAEHAASVAERCSTDIAAEALTREYLDEVNACEEGGVSFILQRYDMGTDRANRQRAQLRITRPYVACGVPVALYHRERESFLMTSATQFSASTEVEEERGFDRNNNNNASPPAAAASSPPPPSLPPLQQQQKLALPLESMGEVDVEDDVSGPLLKSRQRRSTLSGVAALGGAEAAICYTTTTAAAAAAAGVSRCTSPVMQTVTSEGHLTGSFSPFVQTQQQQQRARTRQAEGMIDTGKGRKFPFPVFTATHAEGISTSENLSLLDANRNCTTLWCFEHEEPMLGGPLRYGSSWRYRIRHVVSGMYLAVCGSAVDAMLDDFDDDGSESAEEGDLTQPAAATAPTTTASSTSTAVVSSSDDGDDDGSDKGDRENEGKAHENKKKCDAPYSTRTSRASSSPPPSDRTKSTVAAAKAGTVLTRVSAAATAIAVPASTRETSLCLIPQPRSRKERESTIFCVEPMYATDSVFLIEQTCISIKNVLTEMYVVTDLGVNGSDVALTLDWQPSPADPIIVSYVSHQLQLDTRFIASQCTWLARYRAEMQALVLEHRRQHAETIAAAVKGNEEAKKQLEAEEAYRDALPQRIQPYFDTPDPDKELLHMHKGFMGSRASTNKTWPGSFSARYGSAAAAANHWGTTGRKEFGADCDYDKNLFGGGGGSDAAAAVPRRPSYAALHNTIRLCQRALIALIEFCTESDETNVLRREGLPIKSRQALFYEMRFHQLLFDVVMAPFQLLHSAEAETHGMHSSVVNSIAALTKSEYGSFDHIYETLRMAQQQQADLSCLWSGVWRSSASGRAASGAAPRRTTDGGFDASGEGLLDVRELMLPVHCELHLLTRLALRLLRQIIRDNAATFSTGWSAHIPKLLRLDGLRLHVVDTMQELFTDNPFIPLRAVQQVSEHFISVSQQLRRGAYIDFLGAACTIKYKGVPERQAFVCQRLLVENPQSLCRFVIVVPPGKTEAEGQVYILPSGNPDMATDSDRDDSGKRADRSTSSRACSSAAPSPSAPVQGSEPGEPSGGSGGVCTAPPPGYIPFSEFFSSTTDAKQVTFISNQIALFARLCYDGCPAQCRDVVGRLFPPAAMKCLLRSFVWNGKQVVGYPCTHDVLRSFLIRLAMQCFVLPRICAPAVQLRVSTVLFGSSQLRQSVCTTYSGLPDDEMTALVKSVVIALLRANPFFVQNDIGRSLLLRGSISVWLKLTRYRQYTHEEALTVLPMLMQLLDGTRDVLDVNALHRAALLSSAAPTSPAAASAGSPRGGPCCSALTRLAFPRPMTAAVATDATDAAVAGNSDSDSTSRLVHKVESVHLMRIREMICQTLFLMLQHEVFRAADSVIVYLYKAYTQGDSSHDGSSSSGGRNAASDVWNKALRHTGSALVSAAQMPAVAVKELGQKVRGRAGRCDGESEVRSPLLDRHRHHHHQSGGENGVAVALTDEEDENDTAARQSSLASQRRADGYHEISDSSHGFFAVLGQTSQLRGPAMFSPSWTSQLIRTEVSSAFAELSSPEDDDDEFNEVSAPGLNVSNGPSSGSSGVLSRMTNVKSGTGVSAAEVQEALDYHTSCIVEYFQPSRLVSYLFDVARYDCRPLTAQAMALLVQLCAVKRSIAQLVLKVNTLPSAEVLRSFDRMYEVAVRLREAYERVVPGTLRATQWEPAIRFALDALNGPQSSAPPQDVEKAGGDDVQGQLRKSSSLSSSPSAGQNGVEDAAARRVANFKRIYRSFQGVSAEDVQHRDKDEKDWESDGEEEAEEEEEEQQEGEKAGKRQVGEDDKTASFSATAEEEASSSSSTSEAVRQRREKERIAALWGKTSGTVRVLVYSNTIRNRRRALGLSETSTIPVNVIIRAEMMAHWKIHETLLQMLPYLTLADPVFKLVLQFFYFFSFSESNSLLLQPYVDLFLDKLAPTDTSAIMCLHIIVRVLRSQPHVDDYLTPELLEAVVSHINDELYTKLPDPELVEMLSQYIFSKSSVSPVVRRRTLILFREHGTLMSLARSRLNPTPAEVVFASALVNLVCSICGSHTSVLTLARSMLPAENICSVILQRRIVDVLPSAIVDSERHAHMAGSTADTSASPTAVAALKLLNPYVRVLVALYFIPKNDSQDDHRRRCLQWMGNAQMWDIVRLFTVAMEAVSNAVEQDGDTRVVNRGLNGIRLYRTLLCSTIPVAMAGFLINCFSNEGFSRFQSEVIGESFYELAAAAQRFGALMMRHVAAVNFTVEEVVNFRRFLGVLHYRLTKLNDPTSVHMGDLPERCDATKYEMRVWLSAQQQALESAMVDTENMCASNGGDGGVAGSTAHATISAGGGRGAHGEKAGGGSGAGLASPLSSAASLAASFAGLYKQPTTTTTTTSTTTSTTAAAAAAFIHTLRRRQASTDDDISAFRLLFAEEAVSQAQLRSQEVLEAAGLGGSGETAGMARGGGSSSPNNHPSRPSGGYSGEPEGMDMDGINKIGLLLPGVLASSRGVTAVRASLRATLRGDTIIPSVRRCPSAVSMIAVQHLLCSAHDAAMRGSIICILAAMRDQLLRPRTFVGVLNLFSNALDTALHYPDLVEALCGSGLTGWSDSAVSTPQSPPLSRKQPSAFAAKGGEGEGNGDINGGGGGAWNPDAVLSPESLGYALQTTFNDTGMLNVVISLCGLDEDVISLNAIRLGVLILEGGNRHAQNRLLNYFLTREEGFFHNVRDILRKNLSWVEHVNAEHQYYLMRRGLRGEETKSAAAAANIQIINALTPQQDGSGLSPVDSNLEVFTASKSYVSSLHGDNQKWLATLSTATQVSGWARVRDSRRLKLITFLFRLLQLFCEGHFAGLQNYVRSQHDNLHSANVVLEAMSFIEEMSAFVTPSNYRVLVQGFELLTEVCQGPCRQNQEALINYGVCRVIRHIVEYLQSHSSGECRELTALLHKVSGGAAAQLLQRQRRLLKDRDNQRQESDIMNRLGDEEAAQLRLSISNTLLAVLEGCREAEAFRRVLRQIPLTSIAMEVQYAFNPSTMHLLQHNEEQFESDDRMEAMFNWLIYLKSVEPYAALEDVAEGVQTLLRSSEAVSCYLGSIEIKRADGLERVYFRIPLICRGLTQERKDELLWGVDRTSRATKLADFLHKSDEIIFAVERNHAFHNRIARWTRFPITYYDEAAGDRPGVAQRAVQATKAFYNNYIAAKLFPYELATYDMVSMTLAVLSNSILMAMEGGESRRRSPVKLYGDRVVSVLCILQVIVCSFMCVVYLTVLFPIHLYGAYKTKQRFAAGKVKLNVDLKEVYANLTMGERWRSFLSWFEMQFRLTLLFFAILSCAVSHYFAAFNLMLVVYSIPTLRTFISAITMNGRQLLLTSFMGVIMLYLFSIIGFLVFSNQYNPDDDNNNAASAKSHVNCETLLQCFAYILDQGLRAGGGVGDVMQPWTWGNRRMLARLTYDMLFYALVTVVFLNILFGIIIDTFGQMRDEKREKEADMHGFCFICGLNADTLEKGSVTGFANHVKQEHNMWMYLYFMHHLRRKDPSDYTGQESYVNLCIKRSGLGFFPENNCLSLMEQAQQAEADQANALGDDEDDADNAGNAGGGGGGGSRDEAVDAAARAAMKELTVARETINAHLKEWQSDSMRMKTLLQQLELTSRSFTMDGNGSASRSGESNSLQRGRAMSARSGLTLSPSTNAETLAPSDAVAMEMQTTLSFAGSSNTGSRQICMAESPKAPGLRAIQAQLKTERELRQRYELDRKAMEALLRTKEAELAKLKQEREPKPSCDDKR